MASVETMGKPSEESPAEPASGEDFAMWKIWQQQQSLLQSQLAAARSNCVAGTDLILNLYEVKAVYSGFQHCI